MTKRKPSVAILGAGLSAAFATKACTDMGIVPEIRTTKFHKNFPGAKYLHWVPDSMEEKVAEYPILHLSIGTEEEYVHKMFPDAANISSSFPTKQKVIGGYSTQEAWPHLWENSNVTLVGAGLSDVDMQEVARHYDLVFQSFPTDQAKRKYAAKMTKVAVRQFPAGKMGTSPEIAELVGDFENYLLYHGAPSQSWVRLSSLWGQYALEYPSTFFPSKFEAEEEMFQWTMLPDLAPDTEPDNNSLADNITMIGRYARWDRKMLSHQSYQIVKETIQWWQS